MRQNEYGFVGEKKKKTKKNRSSNEIINKNQSEKESAGNKTP